MSLTPTVGRPDSKDELFDKMRWSKKQENGKSAKVINQERKRDSSSFVAIETCLDSINSRSLTVVFKTGYRQKRVTDPNKEVTDPSTDVTDANTEIYRLQDSILSV